MASHTSAPTIRPGQPSPIIRAGACTTVLGREKARARAHSDGPRLQGLSNPQPSLLRRHIIHDAFADRVDVSQGPFDLQQTLPNLTPYAAYVYVVCPSSEAPAENAAGDPAHPQIFLPGNDFLGLNTLPEGKNLLHNPAPRLVHLRVSPLTLEGSQTLAQWLGEDIQEMNVHLRDEDTFTHAGRFLCKLDRHASLKDLTIRVLDAVSLVGKKAAALSRALRLNSCTTLASLTLCMTLLPGATLAVELQEQLNLAILRDVPARTLRRIRIAFVLPEGRLCDRTMGQLKATRWRAIGDVLPRFTALKIVAVAVMGEGGGDSEVWLEAERGLRRVMPEGVRLVYDPGCIL
ncbi:hypothetical protein PsYK624_124400 [Phanerochaete sordida]|uniref:Uncharacterized protein n=1 Tax=Phanerochaete sordida TaxID=48140 RepID=A0A9P3GJQ6_9APHY|nr:hypothetical protein PsYK624_124400 [Phanerochaete sordida]